MAQQQQNKVLETVNDALTEIKKQITDLSKKVDDRMQDIYEVRFREIDKEFARRAEAQAKENAERDANFKSLQTRVLLVFSILGAIGAAALGLALTNAHVFGK